MSIRTPHTAARLLVGTIIAAVAACDARRPTVPPDGPIVFVSIVPQAYFVKRIAGDLLQVRVIAGPGQSHHTYEPTPKQVAALSQARLYFKIGVPFEHGLLAKISDSIRELEVVDTSRGVEMLPGTDVCEDHDDGHAHGAGFDPHIWLSPRRVKIQAATVCEALSRAFPEHRQTFVRNLSAFQTDLDSVDRRIDEVLRPLSGREFFVFHPAYAYLGADHGLKQVALEEAGKEPSFKQIESLIQRARAAGVCLIFVQPQFPVASAHTIADAIGGAVVSLDPMAEDYLGNLKYMADQIALALGRTAPRQARNNDSLGGTP